MIPFVNHAFFEPQTAAPGLGRAGGPVPPIDQSTPSGLRNNVAVLIAGLVAFALLLNREGTWVPGGNEQIYFLYLFKAWHPHFLAGDWTITGEPTAGHAVFNFCFGWPTLWIPLAAYAWIGRFASWCVLFAGLMRLGSHWRIRPSLVAGGIFLWLVQRQSFVANEWIICRRGKRLGQQISSQRGQPHDLLRAAEKQHRLDGDWLGRKKGHGFDRPS